MSEEYKKQNGKCYETSSKGAWNLFTIIVLAMIIAGLLWFGSRYYFCEHSIAIQEEQTVEYETSSCLYPSYPDYAQFYKNRFPYRHVTKNSSAAFIAFIVCATCVLVVAILSVTMFEMHANKSELARKKLCALKCEKDTIEYLLKDFESKLKETTENGNTETEYYPKNKAVADIYKAFANAIADI